MKRNKYIFSVAEMVYANMPYDIPERCTCIFQATGILGSFFPYITVSMFDIIETQYHLLINTHFTTVPEKPSFLAFDLILHENILSNITDPKISLKDLNACHSFWSTQHIFSKQLHPLNHHLNHCVYSQNPKTFEKSLLPILCVIITVLLFFTVKQKFQMSLK